MTRTFNAKSARAKRPCPLWVDAFQRDTQHLGADEVGAYMLILMSMWTREACDFPDDDARLARICRVSTRLWRSRIGPVLRPFFQSVDGMLISKRLREEAAYTERQVQRQSNRKTGENPDNPLISNDRGASADMSTEHPRNHPTQLPNYPTDIGGGGSACVRAREDEPPQDDHEEILIAAGIDPSKDVTGKWSSSTALHEVEQWRSLGLSQQEIVATVSEVARQREGPPGSLKYFREAMQRFAGLKHAPKISPVAPATRGNHGRPASRADLDLMDRIERIAARAV